MSNEDRDLLLDEILKETAGRHQEPKSGRAAKPSDVSLEALLNETWKPQTPPAEAAYPAAEPEPPVDSVRHSLSNAEQAADSETAAEFHAADQPAASLQAESDPIPDETTTSDATEPAVLESQAETGQVDKKELADVPPHTKKIKRKKFSYVDVLRDLFPWKGDSAFHVIRKLVFLTAVVVFSVCLYLAGDYYYGLYRSEKLYDEIAAQVSNIRVPEPTEEEIVAGTVQEYLQLSAIGKQLLAQNAEAVGYIVIPGTKVNYPVVQRKNSDDGNTYYLDKSFDLSSTKAGSIYLDYRCYFDDVGEEGQRNYENSANLVIYGHNMNDASMFGTLKEYKNNYHYYSEHPIIQLNSNYKTYTYKIFAFFIIDADDESETKYDCWNTLNFATEDEFYDYVNNAKKRSLRLNNVDVDYGDQLLTLFTCNGIFESARFVVLARQVRSGEAPYEGTQDDWANPNVLWPTIYYNWNKNNYDPNAEFIPYGPDTE